MATPSNARLVIQPLLQGWDGEKIHLNLVILPTSQITPLEPLVAGTTTPSLATANFTFDVHITSSDDLPEAGSTTPIAVVPTEAPSSALPLFQSLASSLEIDPAPKKAMRTAGTKLRKYLPKTYQQAVGYVAGSNPLCVTGSEYHCSLRQRDPPTYTKIEPSTKISWGRIVSNLLKNPVLGNATGLCRLISVTITDAALICTGGFLYVTLSSSSEASGLLTGAEELKVYATRFPPLLLGVKRSLFSPILFPLGTAGGGTGPSLDYGEVFAEVTTYDDGWAKAIHCFQPIALDPFEEADGKYRPVKEVGVRLGWDDEQLAVWMNRQLDPSQPQYDSPISVMGYRVDVRLKGSSSWNSLVKASGQVQEGTIDLGLVDTELYVTVNPAQLEAKTPPTWWLPAYFVNWVGPALGTTDALVRFLAGVRERAPAFTGIKPAVNLTYGQTYEFRVRLADNSGGGPTETDGPIVPGRAPVASIAFKRYIRPLPVVLVSKLPPEPDPTDAPTEFSVTRPLLHYPAVACTEYYQRPGVSVDQLLRDDYRQAEAEAREAGLPDPDVHYVRITVEAESFPQDPLAIKGYLPIYTATRAFPEVDLSKPLSILITWTDINDAFSLPTDTGSGPLRLPTARNLRIQLASLCKEDSSPAIYFGGDDVRLSDTIFFLLRRDSTSETGLYAPTSPSEQFSAYYLQPDSVGPEPPIPSVIARLGAALQLQNDGMTLRAPKGRRLILGCDSSLPHQIGPDGASLSFSTKAALALRWTVAIRLVINRDWTWRGFQPTALSIVRDGQAVGVIRVPFSLGNEAAQVEESQKVRTQTEIVFLDCVNPHAAGDEFPQELNPVYRVQAFFEGNPTVESDDLEFTVRLPITTAPKQTPKLASAGIAMSPYQRSDDYSSTQPRQKCLWFEFTEPLADVRDAYFARVLRNVPDPNVFPFLALEDEEPPSLGIDPETTRRIVRGQSADGAGITAMTRLVPAKDSNIHFMLPLPVEPDSPKLFGLWSYEFRIGHDYDPDNADPTRVRDLWSTAQGRFGPPLVVSSIQHPPPQLFCTASRTHDNITVAAPYAAAYLGDTLLPATAKTQVPPSLTMMWFLLYAQATQLDGTDQRNILIDRALDAGLFNADGQRQPTRHARVTWTWAQIALKLRAIGFRSDAPLSVMAVELAGRPAEHQRREFYKDPLGGDLGFVRVLRSSTLLKVENLCGA